MKVASLVSGKQAMRNILAKVGNCKTRLDIFPLCLNRQQVVSVPTTGTSGSYRPFDRPPRSEASFECRSSISALGETPSTLYAGILDSGFPWAGVKAK